MFYKCKKKACKGSPIPNKHVYTFYYSVCSETCIYVYSEEEFNPYPVTCIF